MLTVPFTAPKSRPAHLAAAIFTFLIRGMDDIAKRKHSSIRLTYEAKTSRALTWLEPCFNVRSGVVCHEHSRPMQKCRKPIRRSKPGVTFLRAQLRGMPETVRATSGNVGGAKLDQAYCST